VVVPLLLELIHPISVIDIGCGTGGWLSIFLEHDIQDVTGVDGDYIKRDQLRIPSDRFIAADLLLPVTLQRRYDLVLCIEVAEHLAATAAGQLVSTLTSLGRVVLFSAAIPYQGGVGHKNEQWPDYWKERFAARDYSLVDCIRPKVWAHPQIQPYIAQNVVLFVANAYLADNESLRQEGARHRDFPLKVVHPGVYLSSSLRRPLGVLRQQRLTRNS
jgi:SAM-dependent methyltransferase